MSGIKVITLDGLEYRLPTNVKPRTNQSSLHSTAIEIIRELYPLVTICEEVPIRVYKYKTLYLDIFLPLFRIAIEVHGEQHYKYNSHFFASKADFIKARANDDIKKEWCEYNNISYLELAYNEPRSDWESRIRSKIR